MDRIAEDMASLVIILFLSGFAIVIAVVLVVVFLLGAIIIMVLAREVKRQLELGQTVTYPARMFGAPPRSQWLGAYEHWLFQLEQATGMDFNTTPGRIVLGAVILTVGASLVIGTGIAAFNPTHAGGWLTYMPIVGVIVGAVTGWRLTKPPMGLFEARNGLGLRGGSNEGSDDGVVLGQGDW